MLRAVPLALAAITALTLIAVPWPGNLVFCFALLAFLIAALAPAVSLGVLLAIVPVQAYGAVSLGPIHLTFTKAMIFASMCAWALRVTAGRRPIRGGAIAALFTAYVVVLCLSVVDAINIGDWAEEVYRWSSALFVYLIAIEIIHDVRSARPAVIGTAIGVIGASMVGLYQVVGGLGPASFSVGGLTRAYSTFGQPNPFAGYLEVTVPVLVALVGAWLRSDYRNLLRQAFGRVVLVLAVIGSVLGLAALAFSQSRGGWVGAAAGLGLVIWLTGGAARWVSVALTVLAIVVVLVTPTAGWVTSRLTSSVVSLGTEVQVTPQNFAIQERLAHWRAGINMTRDHPLLGVGAGNFTPNFRTETPVWRFRVSRGHAHNAYIQAAAQSGLVGLVVYGMLVVAVGLYLRRAWQRAGHSAARVLVIGAIGVSMAFAVHNIFDYLHVLSLGVQLSVVWALVEAVRDREAPQPVAMIGVAAA